MEGKMTVLAVEPGKEPYVQEILGSLESLQKEVSGDIQAVYPYRDACAVIVADEGKLMGMPFNRALRDEDGVIYDVLVGKFLIVGLGEENFTSIPEELISKYSQIFETPEQLVRIGEKTIFSRQKMKSQFIRILPLMPESITNCRSTGNLFRRTLPVKKQSKRRSTKIITDGV